VDTGLGGLELRPLRGLGGVADPGFALRVGVPLAQLLDVVGLAEGLGAEGAKGRREGLAVLGVALLRGGGISFSVPSFCSLARMQDGAIRLTSRRRMRSFTTLMTLPMVAVSSLSVSPGLAKSILCPSRRSPRDSSWLLMYSDAVRRLSDSIIVPD